MLTRNQKLSLLMLFVVGIASAAPVSAIRFRADELRPAPSGSAIQGSAVQDLAARGSSVQSSWDAVTLGRVEPRSGEIKIAAPLPGGRIAEVLVKANEEVFAGELLVRLDDEEALARVAEADAQVALQSAPATISPRRRHRRIGERPRMQPPMPSEGLPRLVQRLTRRPPIGGPATHRRPILMRRAWLYRGRRIVCANGKTRSPSLRRRPTRHCRHAWKVSSMWLRLNGA